MSKVRTTLQARKLRPIATELARHSKFHKGDHLYFGGIGWYPATVYWVVDTKPFRSFMMTADRGKGMFMSTGRGLFTSLEECRKYNGVALND